MDDQFALSGKRVLVIGSSIGIGAAVAKGFAAQGASVVVHGNSNADAASAVVAAIEADGGKAFILLGDVTAHGEANRVVSEAAAALGGLDILVNNAGSLVERRPIADVDADLLDRVFDLNARSVLSTCQAALPLLEASGSGAIINVGSIAGVDGGGPGSGPYACSKAYVQALTRHMARDWASRGVRVNAVAPGVVATAFHDRTPPERMEAMRASVPLGRVGTAEDVVGTFLYLASPRLAGYVTGQTIHVNGGQYMAG